MSGLTSAARHPAIVRAFHWTTVALVLACFALAWIRAALEDTDLRFDVLAWHLTCGIAVFVLTATRAGWRARAAPSSPHADALHDVERLGSRMAHATLYVLLLAIPITGYLTVTTRGHAPGLFNALPLPALLERNRDLAERIQGWHELLTTALLVLVSVHVLAALYHHWIRRDAVLRSMV